MALAARQGLRLRNDSRRERTRRRFLRGPGRRLVGLSAHGTCSLFQTCPVV